MKRVRLILDYELMLWAILELALLGLARYVKLTSWPIFIFGIAIGLSAAFPTAFYVVWIARRK